MAKMSPKNPNPLPMTTALPEEISQRMRELTRRERLYFMCMWPKSGVLYITSNLVSQNQLSQGLSQTR